LDLISEVLPIVTRMTDTYRKELGEKNELTQQALKHKEKLQKVIQSGELTGVVTEDPSNIFSVLSINQPEYISANENKAHNPSPAQAAPATGYSVNELDTGDTGINIVIEDIGVHDH
jgi:hypothetical protein